MASKILLGICAIVMLLVIFMAVFGSSYIADPKFTVANKSSLPVMLTVGWDGQDRHYGNVAPGKRIKFSVNAHAQMTLLAKYPDGSTVASPSVYLASGTLTKANIFQTHVEFE